MIYLLDTDHVSLIQRRNSQVLKRLQQVDRTQVAISIITVEEQLRGWLNVIRQQSKGPPEKLTWAYSNLDKSIAFFQTYQRLSFDVTAGQYFQEFRQQRVRVGTQDLRIACIALVHNLIVVTRNQKDFQQIPGIRLEDWSSQVSL